MACITVLMPVFNTEKYLKQAIDSILNQTFSDFEFLIVNDGSTDKSEEIILSYNDQRIKYLKNERNLGIVATMNKGLGYINSQYIVRMDADDISMPNRLEVQKKFMDANPQIGVCSSYYEFIGKKNELVKLYSQSDEIKAYLIFGSQICHPAAIIRTALLKAHNLIYRSTYPHMEDYDLWYRMKDLTEFANIKIPLLKYRISDQNVTIQNYDTLKERIKNIYSKVLNDLGINPTNEELFYHIAHRYGNASTGSFDVIKYRNWLNKLVYANMKNRIFPSDAFQGIIENQWNRLFFIISDYHYKGLFTYIKLNKGISYRQLLYLIKYIIKKGFKLKNY